jgi:pSer/pThr/pTyr-binding forkhead associated (FHA) protein
MINCLLIKISYNKRGTPVRSYRTLTSEELSIGRGAECNIHLLDPRISMHHAVIKRLDDGQLYLMSMASSKWMVQYYKILRLHMALK